MKLEKTIPRVGDRARFEFGGSQIFGRVFVVDVRGGGVWFGVCPSCDMRADEGTLNKHITLNEVELVPAERQ
jgi:hypothetical protein